jgi:hypothetical protein
MTLPDIPFVPARWFTNVTVPRRIDFIVIHDMEMPEKGDTAESCARFFQHLSSDHKASAHYCVDNNSIVQCVQERDIAYHAPPNTHSIGIEHAGFASQTRDAWTDGYSTDMLTLSAELAAELAAKYDLPLLWLTPTDLRAGKRGFTSHANVSKAWGQTSHTDPGLNFPTSLYMGLVKQFATNQEDIVTPEDIAKIADATADRILSDDKGNALRGRIREALDNELGDESGAGAFSDRVAVKVAAKLPVPVDGVTVDLDALAEKTADLLAARLAQ